ncbi:hypothetical protein GGI26_005037 [Coemansia sp. RSA 1358]|nr:hypothetical protein GGI26_005037 [Coemansia sp. RSA 1358]
MDTTIVTTAIPTIAQEFNALSNATWISTTYLLTSTALRPLYGRLSDTFGRLPMLIFATVLFIVGSALCGWAHSMGILIFGRAVQGIGGAGLMLLVFIIVSDVTSEKQRPAYLGALSAVWSIAAVAGPVLGATFSDKASWRWAFLINLPISGAVLISALLFMRLPQSSGSISEKIKKVDFLGALVLIGAVSMLLLAFSWAGKSFPWNSARIIGLLVSGTVALGIFIIIEWMTLAEPIVPIRLFSNRNICLSVFSQFFIGMTLFVPLYFIPLWYTIVKNSSAISSGLHLLPYMLSISLFAIATGFFITKIGHYRIIAIVGSAIAVIGSGLFILFDETISQAKQIGFMIILGIGLALNVQILLLVVQKAALDKDMATATTLFLFMRILGPSISIAVMQSIFQNATLPKLNDLGLQLLNCAWPGSNIFSSARRVKIEYYDDECEYDDSNSVEADHGTVFAILKQTFIQMPKLEEAYIDYIVRFGATEDYKPESAIAHRIDGILTMTIPKIAQQHNIFHKASHPALRHITSIRHRDYYTREYVESQLYLQFTLGLVSTTTQTLELNRQGDIPIFLSAIPEYPRMENIQVLRIFRVNLTLSEIINLVKLLPMLAYLESGFKGLGEEIEKIDYDDLPEHLYSLYYPLSRVNIRIFSTWLRDTDSELQKLNDIWPTNYTFPSARTLAIEYYDGGSGSSTNSVEVEGEIIAAIILRACDQMPRLQKLHIDCETKDNRSSNSEFRPTVAHSIDNILTIALPKIKKLDIGSLGSWVTKSPLSMYENVGLTHLTSYKSYEADIF